MRKLRRGYKRPKNPYDSDQIKKEKEILRKYGLRRKKEIWIAQNVLRNFRQRGRELIAVHDEKKEKVLLEKLSKLGMISKESGLDDVLDLSVDGVLDRRLQTIVFRKGYSKTVKEARQMITHGHVFIGGRKVIFPSYMVNLEEEGGIKSVKE
jgi:small subunit ribosomal protein S4